MLYAFKNALFVHYVLGVVAHEYLQTKGWELITPSVSMLKIIFISLLACILADNCRHNFILLLMKFLLVW